MFIPVLVAVGVVDALLLLGNWAAGVVERRQEASASWWLAVDRATSARRRMEGKS
jgi:hypothetical protein